MNAQQSILKQQLVGLVSYCRQSASIWQTRQALRQVVMALSVKLSTIEVMEQQQSMLTHGCMAQAEMQREVLCRLAGGISELVYFFARKTRRRKPISDCSAGYQLLKDSPQEIMLIKCRRIWRMANEYASLLEAYGLSLHSILTLKNAVEMYDCVVSPPKQKRILAFQYRAALARCFDECEQLLEEDIDIEAFALRYKEPEFYQGYLALKEKISIKRLRRLPETSETTLVMQGSQLSA